MHLSSYARMAEFVARYLDPTQTLAILDVGSMNRNGSYRPLFAHPGWTVTGMDIEPGPEVDVVVADPYHWAAFADGSFDVVISGSTLEHIEYPWLTMQEVARVLRPGGLTCHIAPSAGPEHRVLLDCYRYYSDGFAALAKWAGLAVLSVTTDWTPAVYADDSAQWKDSVLIAQKPLVPAAAG